MHRQGKPIRCKGPFTPEFREADMKTIIKRAIVTLYCWNVLSMAATSRLFARFDLRSA